MNYRKLSYKPKLKQFTYQQKETNLKCIDEENDFNMIAKEREAIDNICQSIAIQESLEFLLELTSDPKFTFYEELPSQIITVINEQLMKDDPTSLVVNTRCLEFIANIWKIPLLVEETLLNNVVSACFQSIINLIESDSQEFMGIAIYSILSISNLIGSTTKEGDECFGSKNQEMKDLDNLLFPQNPSRKSISMEKLDLILSALDLDSEELTIPILQLVLNITLVYKNAICPTIISNDKLASLIDFPNTQNLILLILCNLANDKSLNSTCFQRIFNSDFAQRFIDFAINAEEPVVIFKIYSVLSQYPANCFLKYLDNQDFWDSFKNHLTNLSQYELTDLMNFVEKILLIDTNFLDKYDFWPYIFHISDDFSAKNKEGFATILILYFDRTINFSAQNLDEPPLCFAVEGGFEFLCEILEFVQDPFIFYNISDCLKNLIITNREVFGCIAHEIDLVRQLQQLRDEYRLDSRESNNDINPDEDDESKNDDDSTGIINNNTIINNDFANNSIANNSIENNIDNENADDANEEEEANEEKCEVFSIESTISYLISIISHFCSSSAYEFNEDI